MRVATGVHAQWDAAGVGAERKSLDLDEPQLVALDHDAEFVNNDEAAPALLAKEICSCANVLATWHASSPSNQMPRIKVRSVTRARVPACPGVRSVTTTK